MGPDGMLWWLAFIVVLVSTGAVLLAVWLDTPTARQRELPSILDVLDKPKEDDRCDDC